MRCTECHQFRKRDEDATAPDLTGYGSREWLTAFVGNPAHERFYGKRNDRMPAFTRPILDDHSIGLVWTGCVAIGTGRTLPITLSRSLRKQRRLQRGPAANSFRRDADLHPAICRVTMRSNR